MDDIKFWIVTKPTPFSTLQDICFESSPRHLLVQCRGGLKPEDVVGAALDEETAVAMALEQLEISKGAQAAS